eukprot:sb/3464247/
MKGIFGLKMSYTVHYRCDLTTSWGKGMQKWGDRTDRKSRDPFRYFFSLSHSRVYSVSLSLPHSFSPLVIRDTYESRRHTDGSRRHNYGSRRHNYGSRRHNYGSRRHNYGSRRHNYGSRRHNYGSRRHNYGSRRHNYGSRRHNYGSRRHNYGSRRHNYGSRRHNYGSLRHTDDRVSHLRQICIRYKPPSPSKNGVIVPIANQGIRLDIFSLCLTLECTLSHCLSLILSRFASSCPALVIRDTYESRRHTDGSRRHNYGSLRHTDDRVSHLRQICIRYRTYVCMKTKQGATKKRGKVSLGTKPGPSRTEIVVGENGQKSIPTVSFFEVSIDSLHQAWIGSCKAILVTLFGGSTKKDKQRLAVADKFILGLTPPHYVERYRGLEELKHWKGHEIGLMTLSYSVQLFEHLASVKMISDDIAKHWYLLANALARLNGTAITSTDIDSDPDLVTYSGERNLGTKSGLALNRGQIPLISYIGGNLSCH